MEIITNGEDGASVRNSLNNGIRPKVLLASDVVNNNATPDTLQDVTGLEFAVEANIKYWFRFIIPFTAQSSATGSRWAVNGPALTSLIVYSRYPIAATTATQRFDAAYDGGAVSASSIGTGNIAVMEGFVECSAAGNVIARFSSEVAGSAITAQAGAFVEYYEVA